MEIIEFLKIYLPALEKALANDYINYGYYVKGPEDYIEERYLNQVDAFIKENSKYRDFFYTVAYYFDSKSHNFPKVGNVDIEICRIELIKQIDGLKIEFDVS